MIYIVKSIKNNKIEKSWQPAKIDNNLILSIHNMLCDQNTRINTCRTQKLSQGKECLQQKKQMALKLLI